MNILCKEHCNFSKLEVKTGHMRDWHDSETYNFDSCLPIYSRLDHWNMPNLLAEDWKVKQSPVINPSFCNIWRAFLFSRNADRFLICVNTSLWHLY
jgi:hypothetical protein